MNLAVCDNCDEFQDSVLSVQWIVMHATVHESMEDNRGCEKDNVVLCVCGDMRQYQKQYCGECVYSGL